jgi:type II secretory pathway pseudopilin PulG
MNLKNGPHCLKIKTSGMTILELVVAMSIAGIVVGLVMSSYLNITKGFFIQINKSAQVMQLSVYKKQIDRLVGTIGEVVSVRDASIDYKTSESDTVHTIHFEKNVLKRDTVTVARNVDGFLWSLVQPNLKSGRAVLCWEARVGNGWIGGAGEVVKQ